MNFSDNESNLIIVDDEDKEEEPQPLVLTVPKKKPKPNNPVPEIDRMIEIDEEVEIRHRLPVVPQPSPPKYIIPKTRADKVAQTNPTYLTDPLEMSLVSFIRQKNLEPLYVLKVLNDHLDQKAKSDEMDANEMAEKIAKEHSERNKKFLLHTIYNKFKEAQTKEYQPKEVSVPEASSQDVAMGKIDAMFNMVKQLLEERSSNATTISKGAVEKQGKCKKNAANAAMMAAQANQTVYGGCGANGYGYAGPAVQHNIQQHVSPSFNPLQGRYNNYDMGPEQPISNMSRPPSLNSETLVAHTQARSMETVPNNCRNLYQFRMQKQTFNEQVMPRNAAVHENRTDLVHNPGMNPQQQNLEFYKLQEWRQMQQARMQERKQQHSSTYVPEYNYPNTQWSNYQLKN